MSLKSTRVICHVQKPREYCASTQCVHTMVRVQIWMFTLSIIYIKFILLNKVNIFTHNSINSLLH